MTRLIEMLPRAPRILRFSGKIVIRVKKLLEEIERAFGPILDLGIRIWLGHTFLLSGLLKVADWNTAILLATHEYPVSWLAPEKAALVGAVIEVGGGTLMIAGLATRVAAVAMLSLSIVVQAEYVQLNEHVYWVMLFGLLAVRGAGSISLDHLISRGGRSSAVPLAPMINRLFCAIDRYLGPIYYLGLRIFLMTLLTVYAFGVDDWTGDARLLWFHYQTDSLPLASPGALAAGAALTLAALIAVGLSTRAAALVWGAVLAGNGIIDPWVGLERIDMTYWLVFLALLAVHGAGRLSVDRKLKDWLAGRAAARLTGTALDTSPQVVIVGAGFGGLAAARGLRNAPCRVTLIDRRNYHLFQPLLYQVATASLSPADIATPIREFFRDQPNTRILMGRVMDVDRDRREVVIDKRRIHFDYLVIATGARHAYFGKDEWEQFAPGLKKIDDATEVRRRLLSAFEEAESTDDAALRRDFLTFVIVGGGPTGVELAGAIAELARNGMTGEFRNIEPASSRVLLIQAAPRLLPTFPKSLSADAERALGVLGVEVLTSSRVEEIDGHGVVVNGTSIGARTVFWAAGVCASPAARWLGAEADPSGRVKVRTDLSIPGDPDIYVIGDTAMAEAWDGLPAPGLAPAAKQAGRYIAHVIGAKLDGDTLPRPFRYRHRGSLATIGRSAAVADFGWLRLSGAAAWWLWGLVHIFFLTGVRNRLSVALEWFWAYLTFRRGTRLITGDPD